MKPGVSLAGGGRPGRERTAHEYVKQALRQAILNGTLRGGTRLVQADLLPNCA